MRKNEIKEADQRAAKQALETAIQTSELGTKVVLADLVDFPWDRVCSFLEGDPSSFVNKQLGFEWFEGKERIWNEQYLIFTHDQQVTMEVAMANHRLLLDIPDDQACITKDEAIFRVESSGLTGEGNERRYLIRIK